MSIAVSVVESKAELKKFIRFPQGLYRGNLYWVPPLIRDEIEMLTPGRNPAFENAEARCFLARREGRIVGRVAAVLSHAANRKWGTKNLRFSWFDTVDDFDVASALIGAVEEYGRQKGMKSLSGPHSFTDLDPEGVLVEGFKELATISVFYNHPYYAPLLERCGFAKDVDYVEFQALAPAGTVIPEKMVKMAEWAARRNGFRLLQYTNITQLRTEWGQALFDLVDESFEELYGTVPLTQKQKDYYINKYVPFANPEFIKIVVNEKNVMIGFLLSIPSLAKAMQKARGRLFPFGFLYILRALKKYDTLDFLMAGVKKEYRGKGISLMMTIDVFRSAMARGIRRAESNPELETNAKIQNEWKVAETRQHKRRRIYKKAIR